MDVRGIVVRHPKQCPFRKNDNECLFMCVHVENFGGWCGLDKDFPCDCPLERIEVK